MSPSIKSWLGLIAVAAGAASGLASNTARAAAVKGPSSSQTPYLTSLVPGFPAEPRENGIASGTTFSLAPLGNVERSTGVQLQAASAASGVTEFLRPEDGHWDTKNPNLFYFVTTDRFDTNKNPNSTTPAGRLGARGCGVCALATSIIRLKAAPSKCCSTGRKRIRCWIT